MLEEWELLIKIGDTTYFKMTGSEVAEALLNNSLSNGVDIDFLNKYLEPEGWSLPDSNWAVKYVVEGLNRKARLTLLEMARIAQNLEEEEEDVD